MFHGTEEFAVYNSLSALSDDDAQEAYLQVLMSFHFHKYLGGTQPFPLLTCKSLITGKYSMAGGERGQLPQNAYVIGSSSLVLLVSSPIFLFQA